MSAVWSTFIAITLVLFAGIIAVILLAEYLRRKKKKPYSPPRPTPYSRKANRR